jgi:4-phytase/acid phosphatase
MTLVRRNIIPLMLPCLLLTLATAVPTPGQTVTSDDTVLKQIIIFGRHSIRSPTSSPADYAQYSPRPYPDFGVSTGYLTPHGAQAEALLGAYYRAYLLSEGLLTGDNGADLGHSYFRSNSIQRSNLTATMLGSGLYDGQTVPVHSFPLGQPDPVFDPILSNLVTIDPARAAKEVQEIYNSGAALASAYSGELSLIRSVLFNYQNGTLPLPPAPTGIIDPTAQPIPLDPTTTILYTGNVVNEGGLLATANASDPFVMEYADGFPLSEVGWGQLSLDTLSQQTRIGALVLGLEFRPPYLDQVQSSNAGSHILRTMRQAVLDESIPGAFGDATSQVVVVISSDAYLVGVSGLLDLHWQLPGYQPDFCPPGGALVFELRQSTDTGEYLVRVFYTAQSFDQLRNLTPLTLDQPPETIQLMIPGGHKPGASMDIKFETFQKLLTKAIGPQYVQDPSTEVPPDVLPSVPLQ